MKETIVTESVSDRGGRRNDGVRRERGGAGTCSLGGSRKTRSHRWALGRKGSEMGREEDLVSRCPMNMTVEVTWPGCSSSASGHPQQM